MSTARWLAATVVLALAAGCSGASEPAAAPESTSPDTVAPEPPDTVAPEPWGEQAVAWFDALEEAAANGLQHLPPFIAADLVWDNRIDSYFVQGEDDWFADADEAAFWEFFLPQGGAKLFVSADEVLSQRLISYLDFPVSWLDTMVVGPDGLSYWSRAGSLDGGRHFQLGRSDYDMLDGVADRYVALWNGSPDIDAASLYADDAVISDSLLGESVSGLVAIDRSVGSGSWPSVGSISIADLPEGGGRAVHGTPSDEDRMRPQELRLMIEVDEGSGCPGLMAVALGLDGEQVTWERRYHDITSVRRCYDPTPLQTGWWDEMQIPSTVATERTGTVSYGDIEVEVFNGTPELDGFLQWGFSRFEAAGLAVPQVSSVTLLNARAACYNLGGQASTTEEGTSITLCRTPEDICLDDTCQDWVARSRQLWLHELAHPWLDKHTDDATRAAFLEFVGLPRWADQNDPWQERGVERAADTIAFGLMDEPVEIAPEFHAECEERAAGFRVLTRADPIAACLSEPSTPLGR
jgi:hypothetical protein